MGLDNTWVGYFSRSYQQAKEDILNRLGITTPEMSDHTESNPYIWIIDIWLGIAELLHYYIDNAAREVFLYSARQYKSAQKIAKLFNYRLKGYSAASTILRFYIEDPISTDIVIPAGTILMAEEIPYMTTTTVTIEAGNTEITVLAIQRVTATANFTSNGNPSQWIELEDSAVDKSLTVTVDNITYSFVEDFYLSIPDSLVFTTEITPDKKFRVIFGDDVNGKIPSLNAEVVINYYTSSGSVGNVAAGEINEFSADLDFPVSVFVTNDTDASGGGEIETLASLKKTIPASLRTLKRAVTPLDFKDIAEGVNGVEKAFVSYECGASVDVYIVPTGIGGATPDLLESVRLAFYGATPVDATKLIMMEVTPKPAGRIAAVIVANVTVSPVYNRSLVTAAVKQNLMDFLSAKNQDISGSVYIGDIYQVIENTEGVAHSQLELLSTIPEATIINGTSVLDWTRVLSPNSTAQLRWTIKYIGDDEYELRKGSSFLGQFQIGQNVVVGELNFTVNDGPYVVGDMWEFTTYRYNGTIELNEPSIITLSEVNINLTVTGGV